MIKDRGCLRLQTREDKERWRLLEAKKKERV
jgi:hypothetical protein